MLYPLFEIFDGFGVFKINTAAGRSRNGFAVVADNRRA